MNELINYVFEQGMDPSYEITKDGKGIGQTAMEFLVN
jgi:hypothetical protein